MQDQLELGTTFEESARSDRSETQPSVTVGRLAVLTAGAPPLVDFPTNNSGSLMAARTLIGLSAAQAGSEVALVFEDGDPARPLIVGVLQEWDAAPPAKLEEVNTPRAAVRHDEDSLRIRAGREITLECGKASITLTSAGKLLLRGAYLLSRSSGVNRIKGGSVQIN